MKNNTPDDNFDLRNFARSLYLQGWKISAIARELKIKAPTVYSWFRREEWNKASTLQRASVSTEARFIQLINLPSKSVGQLKEINQLKNIMLDFDKRLNPPPAIPKNPRQGGRSRAGSAKNHFDEEQIKQLKANLNDLRYEYQKEWHKNKERARIILKSRQIGATFYFAGEALEDALETGRNQIFLSASQKQALIFKEYIADFAREVGVELEGDTIILSNSAKLYFLGTNSRTAQGRNGNIYMDEFAWIPKFIIFNELAATMSVHDRFRRTYLSTPSTKSSDAFSFWAGAEFNKNKARNKQAIFEMTYSALKTGVLGADAHHRQIVTILDAVAGGCDLFNLERLKNEYSDGAFAKLFMCEWADDGESIFPLSLLQSCQVDSYADWAFYKKFARRPLGNTPVWIGYDPTKIGDAAGLVVMLPPDSSRDSKWRLIEAVSFDAQNSFQYQADVIKKFFDTYNVQKMVMDITGVGAAVAEIVRGFYPRLIELKYTLDIKAGMIRKTEKILKDKRFEFDAGEQDFMYSMLGIRQVLTRGGRAMTYVSERSEKLSHCDTAWAAMNLFNEESFTGKVNEKRGKIIISQ